jgi:hypothetical protein
MCCYPLLDTYTLDVDLPAKNTEVISSFYTEELSLLYFTDQLKPFGYSESWTNIYDNSELTLRNFSDYYYHNSIPFYINIYGRMGDAYGTGLYNGSVGSLIRLNDYFAIPLFFNAVGTTIYDYSTPEQNENSYHSIYTGGGLVFSSKYGTLGAFAGYYNFFGDDDFPSINKAENSSGWQNHIKYGVIPILDITQHPYLKYVLKGIQTYLSFDFTESKLAVSTSSIKVISRSIPIIKDYFTIDSIYYAYKDDYLSATARTRGYAGGISFELFRSKFTLEYEAGILKTYEMIPGILRYSYRDGWDANIETDVYKWYNSIFFGLKWGDFLTYGAILRISNDRTNLFNLTFAISAPVTFSNYGAAASFEYGQYGPGGSVRYRNLKDSR